jgi:hypothetical protein
MLNFTSLLPSRVRHALKLVCLVLFLTTLSTPVVAEGPRVTGSDFDAQAFAALPVEKSYTFQKTLTEGTWQLRRDPNAEPAPGEMAIPKDGWSILIEPKASVPLLQAAKDLHAYLDTAMQTHVNLETAASLADGAKRTGVIVAGNRAQLPGCGGSLTGIKDYQIIVTPERIVVCGYDDLGAMYGLYNLEERMDLREAPFLPRDLNTVRHSLYKARMTLSGLGWMEWPDKYLAWLPRYGFDSLFDPGYANPNGVKAPAPYYDKMRRQDPARMHDLVRRATQYGIKAYSPILYKYTGTTESIDGLRKLVRDIVTEFPEIRGYVLLTEGFDNATDPWDYKGDMHKWLRDWAQAVGIVTQESHKLNPAIEVLPWEYNIDFRPSQVELKRYAIDQLPQDTIPLVTFENGKDFILDGEHSYLKDYAISQVGPSEVAEAQIAEAKKRGMRGVYAKADTWATWQFGTFPHLPFPYQWYERYKALEKCGIDGTMESWSYGFKPNFVAEIRAWYSWTDAPPLDDLLRQIARRDFGPGSEDLVLNAWKLFSNAIRLDPDTGPTAGGNNAVANPLFFKQPESHIMTLAHSWTDQETWSSDSHLNPYWPYVFRGYMDGYVLYPDFTNRTNVAEEYAKPLSLPVFKKYLLAAADEMEKGLMSYRTAALNAPPSKRVNAFKEVLLAEQLERMLRSNEAVLEFEDSRFHLMKTEDQPGRDRILDRMIAILVDEIPRTQAALETARRDSRLGYEWEEDYMYWPETLEKKLQLLKETLAEQIPTYKAEHR